MENLSAAETLRQALKTLGPSTCRKLAEFTGIDVLRIGPTLGGSLRAGCVERGWEGNRRIYGIAGSIKKPTGATPRLNCSEPVQIRVPSSSGGAHIMLGQQASALERHNRFYDAAQVWQLAARRAAHPFNIEYYENRAAFCANAIAKRWGSHDE